MAIAQESKLTKWAGPIATVVCTMLVNLALFAFTYGQLSAKHDAAMKELDAIRKDGTVSDQTGRMVIDGHERRIVNLETRTEKMGDAIAEIRSDVRLIAEWVKNQNGKPHP